MPSHPKIREINAAIKNKDHAGLNRLLDEHADINPSNHIRYAAAVSSEPVVNTLLEKGADPNYTEDGDYGETPLTSVLTRGNLGDSADHGEAIVDTLLKHGAKPNERPPQGSHSTPLLTANQTLDEDIDETKLMGDSPQRLAALHRIKGKFSGIVGGRRSRKHSKRRRKHSRRKTARKSKRHHKRRHRTRKHRK